MNEHAANQGQEPPDVVSRPRIPLQALDQETLDGEDAAPELMEYFPNHLCDFYDLLKSDYRRIRLARQIMFYETRIVAWLCVVAGLLICFKASFLGGSIISAASLALGFINKLVKLKHKPYDGMEQRLETMRLTALDIERICLRVRFAQAVNDEHEKDEVMARLARDEAELPPEPGEHFSHHTSRRHEGRHEHHHGFSHHHEYDEPPHYYY